MSERPSSHAPPEVTADDLLAILPQEVISDHGSLFTEVAPQQPALVREILRRAFIDSGGNPEVQRAIVTNASFAIAAIHEAYARKEREHMSRS